MAGSFKSAVDRFDNRADLHIARWRGNPFTDRFFYAASFLGDHGLIWILLSIVRYFTGVGGEEAAHYAGIRAAIGELGQSILVNVGIKSLFRRSRPVSQEPRPFHLRIPRTSSFPSGHATASFCGAVLLSQGTNWAPALFLLAAAVSFSRAYVRIHHASDVVGGVFVGMLLGFGIAYLFPLP